jgi:hypothetical protein
MRCIEFQFALMQFPYRAQISVYLACRADSRGCSCYNSGPFEYIFGTPVVRRSDQEIGFSASQAHSKTYTRSLVDYLGAQGVIILTEIT